MSRKLFQVDQQDTIDQYIYTDEPPPTLSNLSVGYEKMLQISPTKARQNQLKLEELILTGTVKLKSPKAQNSKQLRERYQQKPLASGSTCEEGGAAGVGDGTFTSQNNLNFSTMSPQLPVVVTSSSLTFSSKVKDAPKYGSMNQMIGFNKIEEVSIRREISGFSNFSQTPTNLKKPDVDQPSKITVPKKTFSNNKVIPFVSSNQVTPKENFNQNNSPKFAHNDFSLSASILNNEFNENQSSRNGLKQLKSSQGSFLQNQVKPLLAQHDSAINIQLQSTSSYSLNFFPLRDTESKHYDWYTREKEALRQQRQDGVKRWDQAGAPIGRAIGRKHHVVFRDDVSPKMKLADVHIVESYKEFNVVYKKKNDLKDLGKKGKKNNNCDCAIF